MALIKCPECENQVSDKAGSCPHCGCPIADKPTIVKIRCLSDDRTVRRMKFYLGDKLITEASIGSVVNIKVSGPVTLNVKTVFGILNCAPHSFLAEPGKCYEARYCKPGFYQWTTQIKEVSFV